MDPYTIHAILIPAGYQNIPESHAVINSAPHKTVIRFLETKTSITAMSSRTKLEIKFNPFHYRVTDNTGRVMVESQGSSPLSLTPDSTGVNHRIASGEKITGLGWRTGSLVRNGTRFNLKHKPTYNESENFYAGIPFWYGHQSNGNLHGLFMDDTSWGEVDIGATDPQVLSFKNRGGILSFYIFAQNNFYKIIDTYTRLTGRPFMPPRWSIGYHQCRWSYLSEHEILDVTSQLRKRKIPADGIWFDIDYMNPGQALTIDSNKFPNPRNLLTYLKQDGFHNIFNISPFLFESDPLFREAARSHYLVGTQQKNGYLQGWHDYWFYVGKAPSGHLAWLDFFNPTARHWWSNKISSFLDFGVDGIWNDLNEPDGLGKKWPAEVTFQNGNGKLLRNDRHGNAYALKQTELSYQTMLAHNPKRRPFILSRSGGAGIQRAAAVWSGDNAADWETGLKQNIPMGSAMSISGVPFNGHDVGGFFGYPNPTDPVDPELYTRWMQFGTFTPFFRQHKDGGGVRNYPRAEPWGFGQNVEDISRKYIELRYRLKPYLYSLFYQAHTHGAPIQRPTLFDFPQDDRTWEQDYSFMFGPSILVSPVTESGVTRWSTYLPEGTKWTHYWDGRSYDGGQDVTVSAPLEQIPLFLKSGSIIPLMAVHQYDNEPGTSPNLTWLMTEPGTNATTIFPFYEDDGISFAYQKGEFATRTVSSHLSETGQWSIVFSKRTGTWQPLPRVFKLEAYWNYGRAPKSVKVNNQELSPKEVMVDLQKGKLVFELKDQAGPIVISIEK